MSEEVFDAGWLALREPVDHRSRSAPLGDRLRQWWKERGGRRVLDLGAGSGSNLRYLRPLLGGMQEWTLVDRDPDLLRRVGRGDAELTVHAVLGDLSDRATLEAGRADLVTASALLDLVSHDWLESLAAACSEAKSAALFALSYDGVIEWMATDAADWGPGRSTDRLVRDAVNAHQKRDKGLGPALGPDAADAVDMAFRLRGYRTWALPSPWNLGPDDAALTRALVAGWAEAAMEQVPAEAKRIRAWATQRTEAIASGALELRVGHVDVLALPLSDAPA